MKRILPVCILLMFVVISNSQTIESLQKSLDSLKSVKESYQTRIREFAKKITEIDKEYSNVEKLLVQKRFEQNEGEPFIGISSTGIYKTPNGYELLAWLQKGSKVKVLDQEDDNFKIVYNDVTGWVLKGALIPEAEYERKIKADAAEKKKKMTEDSISLVKTQLAAKKEYEQKIKVQKESQAKRKAELINKYGTTNAQRILEGKIWLGMTSEMARDSWGSPNNINRDVGSWGVHEQWVYGDTYVYFENGILTSWSEQK